MREQDKNYLIGLSDGYEIIAQHIKKLARGRQSRNELLSVINGIITALHLGKAEVEARLDDAEGEHIKELMRIVQNAEQMFHFSEHTIKK